MNNDTFYLAVSRALSDCQLVEYELKLYLSEAIELARKLINGRMPFNMNGRDFEDSSLEGLINQFKKFSTNAVLHEDLDRFKKQRNELAHRGIVKCLDLDDQVDFGSAERYMNALSELVITARSLRERICDEGRDIRVELDFGDPPEN